MLEIYEIKGDKYKHHERRGSFTPLQWSKSTSTFTSIILHQLLINPHKLKNFKLNISIKFKPSYINSYSEYQKELIGVIKKLRGNHKTFKEIANHLNTKNYKSIRNKRFTPQLIFGIYKKHLIKLERENNIQISIQDNSSNSK